MAWIESHDTLRDHPKTRRAARALGVSIPTMMGHLHLLWHWCLQYAEDGCLSDYDHADIADAMMWEGDPDKLVDALVNCGPGDRAGFLDRTTDGDLIVHDWMDYAGKLVAKRQEAREAGARGNHERWHVQRGIVDPDCPYCSEFDSGDLSPSESGGESGGDGTPHRESSHRTVPYPTVPNHTKERDRAREPDVFQQAAAAMEAESTESLSSSLSPVDFSSEFRPDPEMQKVANHYRDVTNGVLGPSMLDRFEFWIHDLKMPADVVCAAIDEALRQKVTRISYIDAIVRNWHNDGIRTVADLQARERADPRRRGGYDEEAALAYLDEVLGGLSDDTSASA